jgi:hypothetical protein
MLESLQTVPGVIDVMFPKMLRCSRRMFYIPEVNDLACCTPQYDYGSEKYTKTMKLLLRLTDCLRILFEDQCAKKCHTALSWITCTQ